MKGRLALTAAISTLAVAAPANAGTILCVPDTAGAAVTSGGTSDSCAAGSTSVKLPATAADQQTLLSMLRYMSFSPTGIGGKPTITVKGANLRMMRGNGTGNDGTGNIVMGGNANYYTDPTYVTGSENLLVGTFHRALGNNNIIGGYQNAARANGGIVGGMLNNLASSGHYSAAFGYANTISGQLSSALGGRSNSVSGNYATVDGGVARKITQQDGGAEDVQFVTYGPDSTVRSRSRSDITVYRADKGLNWINVPGAKLKSCAINATVGDGYQLGMSAHRMYDQSYDEWAMIGTYSNGVYADATVNVTIACPTS